MDFWTHIPAIGSIFNAGAIVAGGGVGLLIGRFIPQRIRKIVFQCFGLFSLYLGIDMAKKGQNILLVLTALVLGAVAGELLNLDAGLKILGDRLHALLGGAKLGLDGKEAAGKENRFTEGFVTATLLFCVGSMAILGAIEEGVSGDPSLLFTKGIMDGSVAVLFAASLGVGAVFSALPILVYQGGITLAASWVGPLVTPAMIDNLSGAGGLMIMGIGLNLLEIVEIKTCNLLPGLLFAALFTAFA